MFGVTKAEALLSQTQSDDYNRCLLFSSQYDAAVCVLFFFPGTHCFLQAAEQLWCHGTVVAEIHTLTMSWVRF